MKHRFYLKINNKRIALLAMMLALNIICEVISQYVLGLGKIGGFLSFSITLWTVVTVYLAINELYAVVFLEITEFFRMAFGQDIISTISLNLSDLTFLLIMMLIVYVGKLLINKKKKDFKLELFIILIIAIVTSALITSALDIVYNKYFMLNWYWKSSGSKIEISNWLLITIFWFNIVNFVINGVIVGLIYNPVYVLVKRYGISNTLQFHSSTL